MTRMEFHSSIINKTTPSKPTGMDFSTWGFVFFIDIINKFQKGCANPYWSIQPLEGRGPPTWINKVSGWLNPLPTLAANMALRVTPATIMASPDGLGAVDGRILGQLDGISRILNDVSQSSTPLR